jgi:hypothetical protein
MKTRGWVSLIVSVAVSGALASPAAQAQTTVRSPTIRTIAGRVGFTDGEAAVAASLHNIVATTTDSAGNLIVAVRSNFENRVVRISPSGTLSILAGNGDFDAFPYNGPAGGVPAQSVTLPPLSAVQGLPDGSILIAGEKDLFRLGTNGIIAPLAMNPAPSASIPCPRAAPIYLSTMCEIDSITTDADGNVFVADRFWNRVFKVSPGGTTTSVAGGPQGSTVGDGGPANNTRLFGINGLAATGGSLFIGGSGDIRKVDANGIITTTFSSNTLPPRAAGVAPEEVGIGRLFGSLPNGDLLVQGPVGVLRFRTDGVADRFAGARTSTVDPLLGGAARDASLGQGFNFRHVTSVSSNGSAIVAVPSMNELYRIGSNGLMQHVGGKRYQSVEPANGLALDNVTFISRTDNGSVLLVEGSGFTRVWRFRNGQFTLIGGTLGLPRYQGPYAEGESAQRSLSARSAIEGCNGNVYIDSARIDSAGLLHPLRPDSTLAAEFGTTLTAFRSVGGGCDGVYMVFGGFITKVNTDDTVSKVAPTSANILGSDAAGGVFLTGSVATEYTRLIANGSTSTVGYTGAALPSGWMQLLPASGADFFLRFHDFAGNSTIIPTPAGYPSLSAVPIDGIFADVPTQLRLLAYGSKVYSKVAVIDRRSLREIAPFGTREPVAAATSGVTSRPRTASPPVPTNPPGPRQPAPRA